MKDISFTAATQTDDGGDFIVSFGSGDTGGRTQRSAQGRAGNTNASRNQIASLRGRVNRAVNSARPRTRAARDLRALAQDLQNAPTSRGNITRRRLAALANRLREIQAASNATGSNRRGRSTGGSNIPSNRSLANQVGRPLTPAEYQKFAASETGMSEIKTIRQLPANLSPNYRLGYNDAEGYKLFLDLKGDGPTRPNESTPFR